MNNPLLNIEIFLLCVMNVSNESLKTKKKVKLSAKQATHLG